MLLGEQNSAQNFVSPLFSILAQTFTLEGCQPPHGSRHRATASGQQVHAEHEGLAYRGNTMQLSAAVAKLILEELSKSGLEVKPFREHPEKGVSASAQCALSEPVDLTIGGESGQYVPRINVNVNFFKARTPKANTAKLNTVPAQLARVGALVEKLKGE